MKKVNPVHLLSGLFLIPALALCLLMSPGQSQAQSTVGSPEKFSREELAQMLAPVALYPDALLAQVLMASTYPLEVVEADRWVKRNPDLQGEALDQALVNKDWDPSVKALCHFPTVLVLMSEHLAETTDLGNAFLAQEDEVMDMVQELRTKARAQGNLATTSQQRVVADNGVIVIESINPRVIYVPYYDPFYIYGPWWYPAYPPYYWGPVGVRLGIGLSFWPGVYFGFSFGSWSYFDWPHRHIYIKHSYRPRFVHHDHWITTSGPWHHAPLHRRGIVYRDRYIAGQYGQHHDRTDDFRRDIGRLPERRERLDGEKRIMIDRQRGTDDPLRYERKRHEQQRIERTLQKRRDLEGGQKLRPSLESDRRLRPRPENAPPLRPSLESDPRLRPDRPRMDTVPRERGRTELQRQERQRIERETGERSRPLIQQRNQLEKAPAERIERGQPRREQGVMSPRHNDGGRERPSGERRGFGREERHRDSRHFSGERGEIRRDWGGNNR